MNPPDIKADSMISRTTHVIFSKLDDELLAIDSQAGYCYSMNETAGRVWDCISSPVSITEICSRLCAEYSVDNEVCKAEVILLLQEWSQVGLIQIK